MRLRVAPAHPGARIPERPRPSDAGYDLAYQPAEGEPGSVVVSPGSVRRLRSGVRLELSRDDGCRCGDCERGVTAFGLVRERSSAAVRGLAVLAGVVDAGYRGEVEIVVACVGQEAVLVRAGDRIAQLVLLTAHTPPVEPADSLSETERGAAGFGSTGIGTLVPDQRGAVRTVRPTVFGERPDARVMPATSGLFVALDGG